MVENHGHDATPGEAHAGHGEAVHLPGPSYWPFALAVCLVLAVAGYLVHPLITAVGVVVVVGIVVAWGLEDPNK